MKEKGTFEGEADTFEEMCNEAAVNTGSTLEKTGCGSDFHGGEAHP